MLTFGALLIGLFAAPAGATDLRMHRVTAYVKIDEGMVFKGGQTE